MKILKTFWGRLFQKPDYPTSDTELIALLANELETYLLPADIRTKDLSLGYYRAEKKERVIAFYQVSDLCFVVFMDKTVQVFKTTEVNGIVIDSGIDLSQDRDHQMEDSYYCWGVFINDNHFRIERFSKD